MRHKIRKEKNGAYFFNCETGMVKFLPEDIFQSVKNVINCRIIYPKIPLEKLPDACFSAPSKVYIELTRKCNLRCRTCYNKAGNALDEELSRKKIFSILDELARAGTFEIRFTGGEPTQRKDFFEIVSYAHKLGFFISVGTNGVWNQDILERISKSTINMVIISIEGPEYINDSIRGKGAFKKAARSLAYLANHTNKILRINMTLAKYNINYMDFVVKLADKYRIPVINTMPIRLNGRSAEFLKSQILTPKDYLKFIKHIEKLRKTCKVNIQTYFDILGERSRWLENQTSLINKQTCAAGVEACVISPAGDIYGCAASNPDDPKLSRNIREMLIAGNVKEKSVMDIWLDSSRWKIYRNLKLNKSKKCLECNFYKKKCFGNCFVSSFFASGRLNAADPYCFAHLLKHKEAGKNVR
jgi:radical SAM protein with 4Fe4S-binding SPASM domain